MPNRELDQMSHQPRMGRVDWSRVSRHHCSRYNCAELKQVAPTLAGQLIFSRLEPRTAFCFQFSEQVYLEDGFSVANRLDENSSFSLLHFMSHVDRDLSFEEFAFRFAARRPEDSPVGTLAHYIPFNTTLLDCLNSVAAVSGTRQGWIRTKFLATCPIFHTFPPPSPSVIVELQRWLQYEFFYAYYMSPEEHDALLKFITDPSRRAGRQQACKVGLDVWDNRERREPELTQMFEHTLQHLLDHLPTGATHQGSMTPLVLVMHFRLWWDGWKRMCPEAAAVSKCAGDDEEEDNEYTFHFPLDGHSSRASANQEENLLEVSIRYGPPRSYGQPMADFPRYRHLCEVVMRTRVAGGHGGSLTDS